MYGKSTGFKKTMCYLPDNECNTICLSFIALKFNIQLILNAYLCKVNKYYKRLSEVFIFNER
jgi:hypothetical protein